MTQVATGTERARTRNEAGSCPVAVVIPARNAVDTIARVLAPLADRPPDWDLLLVDDDSTDDTPILAARKGARVVPSDGRHRDSAARNTGARHTTGRVLVFLDADVVAPLAVIRRAVAAVTEGGRACVFGVYDRGDHLDDLVSRYKNYWIRWSTLTAPRPNDWINTSLAVLPRAVWEAVGGFEEAFTLRHGGGDLDFGKRVLARCGPVEADPDLEVTHLKRFTIRRLLANDFQRARGWLSLAWRRRGAAGVLRRPRLANVSARFSLGVAAAAASLVLLAGAGAAALFRTPVPGAEWLLAAGLGMLGLHLASGWRFLAAARRDRIRGWPLFPALLWIDQLACAAGLVTEATARLLRRPHPVRSADRLRTETRIPGGVTEP